MHGFWTAYKKFGSGKIVWEELFQPSIDLAINGFPVSFSLAAILTEREDQIRLDSALKYL